MSEVTFEELKTRHQELAALFDRFERQGKTTELLIPAFELRRAPDQWYAGAVLNEDGTTKHHLLVSSCDERKTFDETQEWAQACGLSAPTAQEARLIVAHQYGRLANMNSFWTCEVYKDDAAYAWYCGLHYGGISVVFRTALRGAVAVSRLIP